MKLYKRNSNGSIQEWQVEVCGNRYRTLYGRINGAQIVSEWVECAGKNIGRANEKTPDQQALLEAEAKRKKLIKNEKYTEDINDIDNDPYISPMLAKKWSDFKGKVDYPLWSDPKLDGGRGVFSHRGLQTRKGGQIVSAPHVNDMLVRLLDKYPDAVFDGELYNHKLRHHLNEIMRIIRVEKPEKLTPEFLDNSASMIQYWVYDGWGFNGITQDTPFGERKAALFDLLKGLNRNLIVVHSKLMKDEAQLDAHYDHLVSEEFEGQIVRWGDCPYLNKRSNTLLKRKDFEDDEFKLVAFEEGVGKAAGHAFGAVCKLHKPATNGDTTFKAGFRGFTYPQLKKMWEKPQEWIGKLAHVRYLKYSPYGKPLIGKVTTFRHDLV